MKRFTLKPRRWIQVIFPLIVAAIVGFLIAPLVVIIGTAFTTTTYLTFPPEGVTIKWFIAVFSDRSWGAAALNSLLIAVSSAAIASVVAVPAAIVLAKKRVPASGLITTLLVAPIMVPSIMFVLGLMLGYNGMNMAVPRWALVFALALLTTPYILRTMMAALSQLDPALEEAAMSLGASRARAWIEILIPNVVRAYISGAMLAFILAFDDLIVPLFLAGPGTPTLPVRIYRSVAFDVNPEIAAVSSVVLIATAVIASLAVREPSASRTLRN